MEIKDTLALLNQQLTDLQIAEKVGCSQPTINRIRNGKTKRISYALGTQINLLAKKLRIKHG